MRSKVTGIEDSVSEGFDEMLACLPLPGCHETLPHSFRARIGHRTTCTNSTFSPATVEEKEFFFWRSPGPGDSVCSQDSVCRCLEQNYLPLDLDSPHATSGSDT